MGRDAEVESNAERTTSVPEWYSAAAVVDGVSDAFNEAGALVV